VQTVASEDAVTHDCDVFAPCAVGGILNATTIPMLRCKVIAGGANNQLATPQDAERLRERGIVYAPDFVINAGGVLHGGGLEEQHWTREVLDQKLVGIGDAVYEILRQAERDGISTDAAARKIAVERITSSAN
jgi:leucine dehydrogenase